jgi:hypothetical protein
VDRCGSIYGELIPLHTINHMHSWSSHFTISKVFFKLLMHGEKCFKKSILGIGIIYCKMTNICTSSIYLDVIQWFLILTHTIWSFLAWHKITWTTLKYKRNWFESLCIWEMMQVQKLYQNVYNDKGLNGDLKRVVNYLFPKYLKVILHFKIGGKTRTKLWLGEKSSWLIQGYIVSIWCNLLWAPTFIICTYDLYIVKK